MPKQIRCRDPEVLRMLFGTEEAKLFLYGDVAVLARDEGDVQRFLYAETLPKGIPLRVFEELRCETPSIAISRICGEYMVVISDIVSTDLAHIIGHRLAQAFRDYSPFAVRRIDVVTSYRASEDGGYSVRNQVLVLLDTRFIEKGVALPIARKVVENIVRERCR